MASIELIVFPSSLADVVASFLDLAWLAEFGRDLFCSSTPGSSLGTNNNEDDAVTEVALSSSCATGEAAPTRFLADRIALFLHVRPMSFAVRSSKSVASLLFVFPCAKMLSIRSSAFFATSRWCGFIFFPASFLDVATDNQT